MPLRLSMPKLGGRKPDLRSSLSGKEAPARRGSARCRSAARRRGRCLRWPRCRSGCCRPQDPGRLARIVVGGAAREVASLATRALLVDELDQLGLAAGAGAREAIRRRAEEPPKRSTLSCSSGPLKTLPSRADDDVAGGAREVFGLVVGQLVGVDHHAAAAELDVAFGGGVEVGPAAHLARAQDDRQLARGVAARRRLQRRRRGAARGAGGGGRRGVAPRAAGGRSPVRPRRCTRATAPTRRQRRLLAGTRAARRCDAARRRDAPGS